MQDVGDKLNAGNIELARTIVERSNTAAGNILKEGVLVIGRPIAEIESNMDRAADIEIGEMERRLGHLRTYCRYCTNI